MFLIITGLIFVVAAQASDAINNTNRNAAIGLLCCKCDGLTNPQDCRNTVKCGSNQLCYSRHTYAFPISASRKQFFSMNCVSKSLCSAIVTNTIPCRAKEQVNHQLDDPGVLAVDETCCSSDLCNNEEICTPQSPHREFSTSAPTSTVASTTTVWLQPVF